MTTESVTTNDTGQMRLILVLLTRVRNVQRGFRVYFQPQGIPSSHYCRNLREWVKRLKQTNKQKPLALGYGFSTVIREVLLPREYWVAGSFYGGKEF